MDNSISVTASPGSNSNHDRSEKAATGPDEEYHIIAVDGDTFSLNRLGAIRHNFHLHPLMKMESLKKLADRLLPAGQCRFIEPGVTDATPFMLDNKPRDGRSIEEIFKHIDEPGSWIALYDVQTDPEYQKFLWQVMESAKRLTEKQQTVFDVRGFVFISAPPAITPFHIDRENNFWLQMHGRKSIQLWDRGDREVVSGIDVEEFILFRTLEKVRLKDEFRERSTKFDCGPGEGAYFPSTTPHLTQSEPVWVKPGDGVAVSIGIVFYTDVTKRTANVHAANRLLRRLGIHPREPGKAIWLDRLKYPLGKLVVGILRRRRDRWPPPGF